MVDSGVERKMQRKRYFGPMTPESTALNGSVRSKSEIRTERVTQRLLDAASKFFMERGFEATSMGEIARYARASKETFYRHFPGKEDLFKAVVIRGARIVAGELSAVLLTHETPERALAAFGELFLDRVLSAKSISFQRMMMMERERFPELVQSLRADGRERVRASLARYLEEQVARGRLRKMDPAVGARQFLDLVAAEMIMAATKCGRPKPSKAQIRQRVKEAIECFLHGYQA
jgi:TetR/AcrR family transcriptional regulator, mexJK operon transcriptional repressor